MITSFGYVGTLVIALSFYPSISDALNSDGSCPANTSNLILAILGQVLFLAHGIATGDKPLIILSSYIICAVMLMYFLSKRPKKPIDSEEAGM